jgi:DsbC/DsbD-like thiol-disulfide interchange protein
MPAGTIRALTSFACLAILAAFSHAPAQPVRTDHARAEMMANVKSVAPGDSFWAALKLVPDAGWHVYWFNPGDAGVPPRLEWNLPDGWSAGPLLFPYPERFENPPLASYGYKDEVWYPVRIAVSSGSLPGDSFVIRARAEWLICREECLPESADLSLAMGTGAPAPDAKAWAAALEKLPVPAPEWNWRARFGETSLQISWDVPQGSNPGEVLFYPADQGVIAHAAPQSLRREGSRAILTIDRDPVLKAAPDTLRGVLVATAGWPAGGGNSGSDAGRAAVTVGIDTRESRTGSESGSGTALIIIMLALAALILLAVMKRPHVQGQRSKS